MITAPVRADWLDTLTVGDLVVADGRPGVVVAIDGDRCRVRHRVGADAVPYDLDQLAPPQPEPVED